MTWATGWNHAANRYLGPLLGIPAFPVLAVPPGPFHPVTRPLIAAFARRRPTLWIDDAHMAEALAWSRSRRVPTLLIPVAPGAGMSRQHVDQALAWAAGL